MTAIGAVDLQCTSGNWAIVGQRSRGGRRVRRQREKRKGKSVGLRIGTLNVGTGKGRELADMMERRNVDILCVQETRWKGSKARSIGAGFKLFYYGVESKRNGVGVVLEEEFVRNVLEVKRVSDRVMSLKLEIEGVMLNVVSGYDPQVGCELEEKERFWSELDEVMESIPTGERVVIGADFNGHVGEGNTGDEEVMGKFGVKERNLEGQMVVDFAKRMDMAVVNTYFQKWEEHRVTYKSGEEEVRDREENQMVEAERRLKEECCEEFRQKLRQALGGQVVLPTSEVIRGTGRKVLGVSYGRRKEDKETWWWNEEVQDSVQRKRLTEKKWDMDRTEENRQEYKELQRRLKREVSKAKQKAYDELYTRLDTREGEQDLYRLARQRDQDGKDVQQVRVIKDRDGRVLTSEESVQRRWKEYFEELMNEENEREKRVEGVNSVEQKVDKIRKDEVRKALKRMKSGKAVGPDDIPVEVWKCLGEAAVEFLTNLFNRVLENPSETDIVAMEPSFVGGRRSVRVLGGGRRSALQLGGGRRLALLLGCGRHSALRLSCGRRSAPPLGCGRRVGPFGLAVGSFAPPTCLAPASRSPPKCLALLLAPPTGLSTFLAPPQDPSLDRTLWEGLGLCHSVSPASVHMVTAISCRFSPTALAIGIR
ncbi:hypothetical protein QTP86_011511 [Hemibagrus guttatus]|nr:hypothetical protein QTP86_011511 [Hemibagrus guttatus]